MRLASPELDNSGTCYNYGIELDVQLHDGNGFAQLDCKLVFTHSESSASISFDLLMGTMMTAQEDVECPISSENFWREVAFSPL